MSVEIKQINTTAGTTVTKLWQKPLSISATGSVITVNPEYAVVNVTYGSLGSFPRRRTKLCPGYILKFENSMVVQAQHSDCPSTGWSILGQLWTAVNTLNPEALTVRYDTESSSFIASAPCYGVILVKSYNYNVAEYDYTPEAGIWDDKSTVATGVAYATLTPNASEASTMGYQKMPVIKSCDIPIAGIKDNFEKYKISTPTVITDKGEWFKPKDFESDSYDQANAYGPGKEGPSKDGGWVIKNVPIEVGEVGLNSSSTQFTRNPLPPLKGGIEKTVTIGTGISATTVTMMTPAVNFIFEQPNRPDWNHPVAVDGQTPPDPWASCEGKATERCAKYADGKAFAGVSIDIIKTKYVPLTEAIEPTPTTT